MLDVHLVEGNFTWGTNPYTVGGWRIFSGNECMTVNELIDKLSLLNFETEIVGGVWNGRVDSLRFSTK